MDTGLLLFLLLSLTTSVACHYFIRRYLAAAALAGVLSAIGIISLSCIEAGHVDKLALIAFICGSSYGFAISLSVGIPFLVVRRRQVPPTATQCAACRYELRRNERDVCPECGAAISEEQRRRLAEARQELEQK